MVKFTLLTCKCLSAEGVAGFGWFLRFKEGSPVSLNFNAIQAQPSNPIVFAVPYPSGTTFNITYTTWQYCWPSSSSLCIAHFTIADSVGSVRSGKGDTYYFDDSGDPDAGGVLYFKVTQQSMKTLGAPGDFARFEPPVFRAAGVEIPYRWGYGGSLTVVALCEPSSSHPSFCADSRSLSAEPDPCSGVLGAGETQYAIDACLPPSRPSPAPSTLPTPVDTVSVSLAMSVVATAPPTDDQKKSFRSTLATSLGVPTSSIRNFLIISASRRLQATSRLGGDASASRALSTVTWAVSFDLVVSLTDVSGATVGVDSAASLGQAASAALADPGFETAMSTNLGVPVTVDAASVSVTAISTRRPTAFPSEEPAQRKEDSLLTSATSILIGAGGVVLLVGCIVVVRVSRRANSSVEGFEEEDRGLELQKTPKTASPLALTSKSTSSAQSKDKIGTTFRGHTSRVDYSKPI
jgi:hypothetical protein